MNGFIQRLFLTQEHKATQKWFTNLEIIEIFLPKKLIYEKQIAK